MRPDLSPLASSPHQSKEGTPLAHCMRTEDVKSGKRERPQEGCLMGFLLRSLVYVARRGLIQPNLEGVTLQWLYLGELKVYEA